MTRRRPAARPPRNTRSTGNHRRTGRRSPPRKRGPGRGGRRRNTAKRGASRATGSRRRGSLLGWAFKWALSLTIWGAVAGIVALAWLAWDLPDIQQLRDQTRRPGVVLLAADGSRLASYGDLYGARVDVSELPDYLPGAVIAIEDRRYYRHSGIDIRGILRSVIVDIRARAFVQGGSTLTQQLAKNLFLTPERSLTRKGREALLALWLEASFTKDELLTVYLNRVYFGSGTYGVEAAAQKFFGRSAREVSVYQAAQLAGLLKAPSRLNPVSNPKAARQRTLVVLDAMVASGQLSAGQAGEAAANTATYLGEAARSGAGRYYADWIMQQVTGYVGLAGGTLIVETSFDPALQAIVENAVAAQTPAAVGQVAVVVMDLDGSVRAMVGGRNYRASQFNRATQALRQPGSAFKPFVYLAALESGLTPDTKIEDSPITIDGWSPRNYGRKFLGTVTMREAVARSLNSVAVRVSEQVGRGNVAEAGHRLGLVSQLKTQPSLALGASEVTLLELTAAYSVFANGGDGVLPHGIREIRGAGGDVLYRRTGSGRGRVINRTDAETMNQLLNAVVDWGTGKAAKLDRPAAGKTGTSQEFRDAWFIGYTGDLVAGVWMGNDDGKPMAQITGGGAPAKLWRRLMVDALRGMPVRPLLGVGG